MSADKPCDRCAFIPTPDGKCICREMLDRINQGEHPERPNVSQYRPGGVIS